MLKPCIILWTWTEIVLFTELIFSPVLGPRTTDFYPLLIYFEPVLGLMN